VYKSYGLDSWQFMVAPIDRSTPPIAVGPRRPLDEDMDAAFSPDGREVLINQPGKETRLTSASTGGDGNILAWAAGGYTNWQRLAP
jgi:hypothetical protein